MDASGPQFEQAQPATKAISDAQQQATVQFEQEAQVIAGLFPAALLHASSGKTLAATVSAGGYKVHLENILKASGSPTDPIEIMLLHQLVTANSRIADLHAMAACAASPELATAYNLAAAKLMAEFRRSSLALRTYRSAVTPNSMTLVTGNQQVAVIEGENAERTPATKNANSEVSSNQPRLNHVAITNPFPAADCRTPELVEAQRPDARRAQDDPTNGFGEPSLAIFNGAQNTGGKN